MTKQVTLKTNIDEGAELIIGLSNKVTDGGPSRLNSQNGQYGWTGYAMEQPHSSMQAWYIQLSNAESLCSNTIRLDRVQRSAYLRS